MDINILINNGIDVNKGLELLGDMEMYNETLNDFLEESKTRVPNIINYAQTGNLPEYTTLVHAQKSDSKYLGFTTLAELSYNHEMAGRENNLEYIKTNLQNLLDEEKRIEDIVHTYLGK